ncbi:MAG: hypothetical protein OXE99_07650 [Cellvibrionales bacterium]|nr:hypothetical protein [Cellvibrionales bacterium]
MTTIDKTYQYRREEPDSRPPFEFQAQSSQGQQSWNFERLLSPVSVQTFIDTYWGKFPLLIRSNCANNFANLTSIAEVESYLSLKGVLEDQTVVLRSRDRPMRRKFESLSEMYEDMQQGSSLQLREMERFLAPTAPLRLLFNDMIRVLQHPGDSISCFITPPNCELLGPHHDETEIFTLQITGSKRWKLFHRVTAQEPGTYTDDELDAPACEFTLNPGDILYHPRGQIHEVVSENNTAYSITFVIRPLTWHKLLDEAVKTAGRQVEFIEQLPAGLLLQPNAPQHIAKVFEEKLTHLVTHIADCNANDFIQNLSKELIYNLPSPIGSHLEAPLKQVPLTLESRLISRVNDQYLLTTDEQTEKVLLTLAGGASLRMPLSLKSALDELLSFRGPFQIRQIDDALSDNSKCILAKKLLNLGAITFAQKKALTQNEPT